MFERNLTNMNSARQIKMGAIISYITLFLNILVSLIYTPWMVSRIGQANYALFTLSTSFITLFLMDFGLSASVSRYVAKYRAEGDDRSQIQSFISTVGWLYIVIDSIIFVVLAVLYFFLDRIYKGLTIEELRVFKSLYLIVFVYSIVSFPFLPLSGIINAYEKFIQQKLCELFQKLFSVVLIVVALLYRPDVRFVVAANAFTGILTVMIKLLIIKGSIGLRISIKHFDGKIAKQVFSFSIWVTVMSIAQRCIFNMAPTILGIVSNSREIALFGPANALESYFYSFAAAINGLFLATISRYIANDKDDQIDNLAIKVGRYQLVVLGSVFIAFLAAGKQFMISWMGQDYVLSYYCAVLMFIPDVLMFSQQIANTTAVAKNRVKEQAIGYVGMGIICLLVSFALCGKLGALGSSIGIAVSYVFLFVYMNYLYKRKLNMNITLFFKKVFLPFSIPFVFGSISALLIPEWLHMSGWLSVFVYGGLAILIYLIAVVPVLNVEEKKVVIALLRKVWKKRAHI